MKFLKLRREPSEPYFSVFIYPEDDGFKAHVRSKQNRWRMSVSHTAEGYPGEEQIIRDLLHSVAKNFPAEVLDHED